MLRMRLPVDGTPEQIGNRLIHEDATLRVCQETIYRYIYSKEGMAQELWWYLPEHRKARRPRRARKRRVYWRSQFATPRFTSSTQLLISEVLRSTHRLASQRYLV